MNKHTQTGIKQKLPQLRDTSTLPTTHDTETVELTSNYYNTFFFLISQVGENWLLTQLVQQLGLQAGSLNHTISLHSQYAQQCSYYLCIQIIKQLKKFWYYQLFLVDLTLRE